MIIKNNTTKLLVTLSFLLILPFVQKQWFNLYSLNFNDISFYSILYYLSGAICPSLVCLNSRFLLKKIILVNFILISLYLWHLQINNISVDDQFHIYRYFGLNDLNLINLFILVAIEISFYTWSFLSYKTNLSDWIVPKPQKGDVIPFLNIFIFYFFIIIYYSILT